MIRLTCSPKVQRIARGIRNPHEMGNTLETTLDTARFYISRQDILRPFRACQPTEDEPLKPSFTTLSDYHIQLDHTNNAITDRDFCTHIFTSLPSQCAMILMVLKYGRPSRTPEEAMHYLLDEESTASLTKQLGDASMGAAIFTQHSSHRGRRHGCGEHGGQGGPGRNSGTGESHESMCTNYNMGSRTTDACTKQKHAHEREINDQHIDFQCRLPSHVEVDCVSYKCVTEWWNVKKAPATAALATTGDCDPFWITTCVNTASAVAPKWVIDSGVSHLMCNDHSRFSTFKMLSLPIVIDLGDNNFVTVTHYGFVDVMLGGQVEALHTCIFHLCLLSITQ